VPGRATKPSPLEATNSAKTEQLKRAFMAPPLLVCVRECQG
jgi:hypothetical protein